MKLFKRLLALVGILSVLLFAVIVFCFFNPDLADKIAKVLYPDKGAHYGAGITASGEPEGASLGGPRAEELFADELREQKDRYKENGEMPEPERLEESESLKASESYVAPDQSKIVVPDAVSGKNGYQEVKDDTREVEDDEAEKIREELGLGDTGEGLAFDELYYPYYAMLDENGKNLYRQIYANANALYERFAPVQAVNARELKNIFSAVCNDHPELFWLNTAYGAMCIRNGQCIAIDLEFNKTADNLETEKRTFSDKAEEILSLARKAGTDYEKERFIHDALVDRIDYRLNSPMNQSAYSALVNGKTVCAGYARAYQYLLQQMKIPCYYCVGYAGESHAWDIVRLEDGHYNVDVTWDDTGNGTYDYFNKSDGDYAGTHVRKEMSVYLPPCNGEKYRDLEPDRESGRRSVESAGIAPEAVFKDIEAYYDNCYRNIVEKGKGTYEFSNVIDGSELYRKWENAYQSGSYKKKYMETAMEVIGASSCELNLVTELLQDDKYLITHQLVFR